MKPQVINANLIINGDNYQFTAVGEHHIYHNTWLLGDDGNLACFPQSIMALINYHMIENEPAASQDSPWIWYLLDDDSAVWSDEYDEIDHGNILEIYNLYAEKISYLDD